MSPLPIDDVLPSLCRSIGSRPECIDDGPSRSRENHVVSVALLKAPWLSDKRLLLLEPRRLAARAAAHRMAEGHEYVGETVGYRMRLETKIGSATKIEVVTEGVLTRLSPTRPIAGGLWHRVIRRVP